MALCTLCEQTSSMFKDSNLYTQAMTPDPQHGLSLPSVIKERRCTVHLVLFPETTGERSSDVPELRSAFQ